MLTLVGFKVMVPEDPYAMLDDTYLSTLKGDDDMANDAAKKVRKNCVFVLFACAWGLHSLSHLQAESKRMVAGAGLFVLTPGHERHGHQPGLMQQTKFIFGAERTVLLPFIYAIRRNPQRLVNPSRSSRRLRQRAPTDPSTASRATTRPWREAAFVTRDRLRPRSRFRPMSAQCESG